MISFRKGFHFHKYETVQEREYLNPQHEDLGITLKDEIRVCNACGKTEKLDIHCLGLNPPEYVESWQEIKENSWKEKPIMKQELNIKNKPLITQSKLFKEVSSVIGKVASLEELTKAYREYSIDYKGVRWEWDWDDCLVNAFAWEATPQGNEYWDNIDNLIEENAK